MPRSPLLPVVSTWVAAEILSFCLGSPAYSELLRPISCRMDSCNESLFLSKKPLLTNGYGTLYEVRGRTRTWSIRNQYIPRPSTSLVPFGPIRFSFVLCSTKRPLVIFKPDDSSSYIVHRLNPDGQSYGGYNLQSYKDYWLACHNLAGPDYFNPEMVSRSIRLGYPGNLVEDQIEVEHPLDVVR